MKQCVWILSCLVLYASAALGQHHAEQTAPTAHNTQLTPFTPTPPIPPVSNAALSANNTASSHPVPDSAPLETVIQGLFSGTDGTIVLYNAQEGGLLNYNPARADQRFSPFSTFEIAAAAILLDSGILSSADQKITWNKNKYPVHPGLPQKLKSEWETDHTLRSAYGAYAGWFFQALLKQAEPEEMVLYLKRFQYGNQQHYEDNFWLGKDLKISAIEQVSFLHGLLSDSFDLKPGIKNALSPILVTEKHDQYTLALKTGSGVFAKGKAFGWAIGYIERAHERYYFALNIDADHYATLTQKRRQILEGVFRKLGFPVSLTED